MNTGRALDSGRAHALCSPAQAGSVLATRWLSGLPHAVMAAALIDRLVHLVCASRSPNASRTEWRTGVRHAAVPRAMQRSWLEPVPTPP